MIWDDDQYIGFDFETSGLKPEFALQPWRIPRKQAWATSLIWSHHAGGEYTIHGGLFPKRSQMREMLEFARDEGKTIVGWNVIYDISVLIAYGFYELVMACSWLDGMLIARHQFIEPEYDETGRNKRSYSLKKLVPEQIPGAGGYEENVDYHSTDPQKLAELHAYNIKDVDYTLVIAKKLFSKLTPRQQRAVFIEAQCLPLVAAANFQGMLIDVPYAHDLGGKLLATSEAMLAKLAPDGVTEKIIRSPLQLAKLLFDKWKLPVLKMTKSSARSTDKEVLHELSFIDPRAKDLRTYRESLNQKTKFVDTVIKAARYNEDWRPRPQAIVFGTYSGRFTYSSKQGRNKDERQTGFAIHQMKNDKEFREILVAPPGYTLVEFDADSQEYKWMAIASKDPVMLNLCLPGQDPHSFMASKISGLDYQWLMQNKDTDPVAGSARKNGKVSNLSCQYRTSWRKLLSVARVQYDINMLPDQAKKIHSTYPQTYKLVPDYWSRQITETATKGYVETFAGRRVVVKGDWSGVHGWSMGSTAINYRIQGTGADQKYLALMMLKNLLVETNSHFALDMHDGLYFYVLDATVEEFAVKAKAILDDLPYGATWGFIPPIPLTFSCKTGKSWGSLKAYEC